MTDSRWWQELKRRNVVRVGIAYAVMGWVLAQAGQLAFDTFGAPDWVGKVLLTVILLGLPLALFFAWAFELTPQGLKRTAEVDADESITHSTGRKVDFAIIAMLAVAVLFLGWDKVSHRSQPKTIADVGQTDAGIVAQPVGGGGKNAASIAVLPFVNMSADPEQEFFSDGISEELLNLLARIPKLKVAARTSSFAFKGRNENISEIADTLKVSKVLEGSVRKAGTTLRITAQLIEADTGYHLWSETYDRQLDDVFAIQDEIAAAIVAALEQTLGLTEAAPLAARTKNIDAYNAYLEGRQLMEQRGQGPLEQAQIMLEKAIALDPDFAPAYSSLAEAVLVLPGYTGALSNDDAIDRARPLIDRALELAPDSADSLVARALMLDQEARYEEAIEQFDQVLALNPNMVRALMWRAGALGDAGRYHDQLASLRKAVALDPLGYVPVQNTAIQLAQRGQFDEAIATIGKLVRVRPSVTSYSGLATIYEAQGKQDLAHELLLKAKSISPDNQGVRIGLMITYMELELLEPFRQLMEETDFDDMWLLLIERRWQEAVLIGDRLLEAEPANSTSVTRWITGSLHLRNGNPERALELFQPYVDRTDGIVGPLFGLGPDPTALYVLAARRATGDEAGAQELLDQLRAHYDDAISAGFADPNTKFRGAQILTLEGRIDEALALLREVVATGWADGDLALFTTLEPLHDNPEYQQIAADYERERQRQRNAVRKQLGLPSAGSSRQIL